MEKQYVKRLTQRGFRQIQNGSIRTQVHLKPKENNKADDSQNTTGDNDNIVETPSAPQSAINQDESVILSEMKALRQSAVSLSASQKEGATQIIRDWMSDGNSGNSSNNESKE